jgi:hypothetical protein
MKKFQEKIDKQFELNQGKNLFYREIIHSLRFSPELLAEIERIDLIDADAENVLIDYLTNRALEEFCKVNQYYTFDNQALQELRNLYADLFVHIKFHKSSMEAIAETHYAHLIKWLQESNTFAEKFYSAKGEIAESVACSEYSPDLQIKILQLDLKRIIGPVLDIGCGKLGNLVMYLRQNGIEAYGFDRFTNNNTFLGNADWLEYPFEKEKWGTITSNLGFSNHFRFHHFRNDGNFTDYAKKYMDILGALKIGSCFHYAPDLPFIEKYLDGNQYQLTSQTIENYEFKSIKIKRLK